MKIAIVLGTRPDIIKMSPIIKECEKKKIEYFVIHTGQHYSRELDKVFFEELELVQPKYNIGVGSGTHGTQTGKMLAEIENILIQEKPDMIFVHGDTNSALAGALAASKLGIKIGHIEAGLRSYDRTMPEEINRVLTDHVSDYLFVPTEKAEKNALKEGIEKIKIFTTGNTIVDAVHQYVKIADKKASILKELGLEEKKYILVTAHRPSNVDEIVSLSNLLNGFEKIYEKFKLPIIFPIHPRTEKMIKTLGLKIPEGTNLIKPVGFLECLQLEKNAKLILTDSGGVQEEACILNVPSVTLRENTERPETLDVGASILAGNNSNKMLDAAIEMISKENKWENPFGDGKAAEKIINISLGSIN